RQRRSAPRRNGHADRLRRDLPLPGRPHGRSPGGKRLAGLALRVRPRRGRRPHPPRLRDRLGVRAQAGRRRGDDAGLLGSARRRGRPQRRNRRLGPTPALGTLVDQRATPDRLRARHHADGAGQAPRPRLPIRGGLLMRVQSIVAAFGAVLASLSAPVSAQKVEGLALTPPMGWNSWNHYGCNIDEQLIKRTADALVSSGLRDAGYVYVNLDDCWHGTRDERG